MSLKGELPHGACAAGDQSGELAVLQGLGQVPARRGRLRPASACRFVRLLRRCRTAVCRRLAPMKVCSTKHPSLFFAFGAQIRRARDASTRLVSRVLYPDATNARERGLRISPLHECEIRYARWKLDQIKNTSLTFAYA